ncbi:MAG: ABC transporter permease [Ferruginibacter sp.]
MIKNYFKIALRNFWSNKVTGFINLFGLSVGMTAAVFIFLWVQNEVSYDDYHPDKNNIYRITNGIAVSKEETWVWETSPLAMADFAKSEIPEVKGTCRLQSNGSAVFKINNKIFSEKLSAYVDKGWFNTFKYDVVAGDTADFNKNPFSIILTETKAKKYFGNANPVGQTIGIDTVNYTVQGVVKDNPLNSSFQFDVLIQLNGRLADPKVMKRQEGWNNFNYITFVQLHPNANKTLVESKFNALVNSKRTNNNDKVRLTSLKDMYFETDLQSSNLPHGSKKATYIFSVLAFMLLIIACINYVNLTTARASLRAKEVGVRKIIGAERRHLFFQFLTESLFISLVALIITLTLIQICLPGFNAITEKHFVLPILSMNMWQVLLGTLLLATILNGIYPAVLLSSFNPMNVFRGRSFLKMNDGSIRKGLVVLQFSLSIVLIVGTIVIFRQLQYIQSSNPGYNISQVISVNIPYRSYGKLSDEQTEAFFASIKKELQSASSIQTVCTGGDEIMNVGSSSSGNADWDGHDTTFNPTVGIISVDADFQKLFQVQLKQGNWFKPGKEDAHNYMINETAAEMFNMHKPVIGQRFTYGGDTGRLIGVVKDFHFKSMHEKIGPLVLSNNLGYDSYFFIRNVPGNLTRAVWDIEKIWNKFIPTEPFDYTFMDESFTRLYKSDIKTSQLILIFSIIAMIISALGLFGLAAFTAERRTKEIGIRKVLGATVHALVLLLSKDFIKLVLIALLIASPVAWFLVDKWLQDFAYRIDISWWIFALAAIFAISIAVITVGSQAIKAALANPVKNLRSE